MGLNQNPLVDNAEPHGAEVILISDMQVYTNGFVLHDLGSDQPQSHDDTRNSRQNLDLNLSGLSSDTQQGQIHILNPCNWGI